MRKFFKEPLVHFLAIGLGLFSLNGIVSDNSVDQKTIRVDRSVLLTYMQYQANIFDSEQVENVFDNLSDKDRSKLIQIYVREEALYREALALGMDDNDYIIKKRLVQKIEFLTNGFISTSSETSDQDLQAYYEANKEDYLIPAQMTFTHVFFDIEKRGKEEAETLAKLTLINLQEEKAPFSDAIKYGDRFPYHVNYVERQFDFIASHFSTEFLKSITGKNIEYNKWIGPFKSTHGYHLVMVAEKKDELIPNLDEVYERVKVDAERSQLKKQSEKSIQKIIDQYNVVTRLD